MKNNVKIAELEAEIERLKTKVSELEILNNWYLEQFRLSQHKRFGASSEKSVYNNGQLSLFNEFETVAEEPGFEEVASHKRKKRKGKRKEFYEGLPTEQVIHELTENERVCPDCGNGLHACGREVLRREVEVIPAQVKAVEHIQVVYSCRDCEKNSDKDSLPMVKSNVPAPVIPNSGIASPSIISFIACNKYVLSLPLYRQEQELRRIGVHISRQTMANWMIYSAENYFTPMYNLLLDEILRSDILHADESTLQVIKEPGRKASQKSYIWLYHSGKFALRPVALFEYQPTRHGEHPKNFLEGFTGYLHVDGYHAYKQLEKHGVILVECWQHARSKFNDALKALKPADRPNATANTGLAYCNKLFELERKFDEEELSHEQRKQRRELESKPVADVFFAWAESLLPNIIPKSKFGQAIIYAVNQKKWLMNFLLDGRLELSNNRAERSIRPFTIGRKNWLFSYCVKGANASAVIYSLIESAHANGLVPFMYLDYLLRTLPNIPVKRYEECLPWNPVVQKICKIPEPGNIGLKPPR
jgi:transposase